MTDRYAVIGNPVGHSLSPAIHAAFARQTGEDVVYERLTAATDAFAATAAGFFAAGGQGLNVTLPFKGDAYAFVDAASERAREAGAVNTIARRRDGSHFGDNTDGIGLVRDLVANHGLALGGGRILVVGAGGAARGILGPLLRESPARLVVANRTAAKAAALARRFAPQASICGLGLDQCADFGPYDLVVNATSAGVDGAAPALAAQVFAPHSWAYDLFYAGAPTPFVAWARGHGAGQARDGFGMLVEQAAESFFLWRGIRVTTAPVIAALRPARER